jgi:hypothetical protein
MIKTCKNIKKFFFEFFEKITFLTSHKSKTNEEIEILSFISESSNLALQQC